MHLKTYESLGVIPYNESGGEAIANCRFCGEGKFYINIAEGLYNCKVCGAGGNKYTFLGALYDECFKGTTLEQYRSLENLKGLPEEAFRNAELAYDAERTLWYIPVRNESGSVVNLRIWDKATNRLCHTAGCSASLYNLDRLGRARKVMICEGEWDAIALEYFLSQVGITDTAVVAVPGASTFKEEWCGIFNDRDVTLLYDNDEAGQKGMERALGLLRRHSKPNSLHVINWPEGTPDKFDIRDWVTRDFNMMGPPAIEILQDMIVEVPTKEMVHNQNYFRFEDVAGEFEKHVFFPQEMRTGLLVCMSTLFSNKIPGNPLWVFVVGPPGCLARESEVIINRAGASKRMTIEELYYKFHGGVSFGGKVWDPGIETKVQYRNEEDGTVRLTTLRDVVSSGVKKVWKVKTFCGKEIEATEDHRFFTQNGWRKLSDLRIGSDRVCVKTEQRCETLEGKSRYRYIGGMRLHPFATKRNEESSWRYQVLEHRLVVEAELNGMTLAQYVTRLKTFNGTTKGLKFLQPDELVHHIDGDSSNNALENLQVVSAKEHAQYHNNAKNVLYKTDFVHIESIRKAGIKQTFDLCVDEPHNFVSNDFVVHNSGKSLLLQTLSDNELTHYESSLGAKTLVSGFKTSDGSDPSLLPKIIGKTLVIKEYTEILGLPGGEQENIFAVLRGAYDGRVERTYPHGVVRIYPEPGSEHKTCHFSILAGVTNAIHGDSRAALGERFLKYQLFPDNYDPVHQVKSAMSNAINLSLPEYELRECVNEFIEHKLRSGTIRIPGVPESIKERIIGLSSIVSIIRANVSRKSGELQYRPAAEVGTRLSTQLVRMAQCTAFTLGRPEVDEDIYKSIVQRMGLDTCYGWHRDVVLGISYKYPEKVLKETICLENRLGSATCNRCLEDLYELGAIEYDLEEKKPGSVGRPARLWQLAPQLEAMFHQADLLNTDLKLADIPDNVRYQIRRRGKEKAVPIA